MAPAAAPGPADRVPALCNATEAQAKRIPLDMIVLVDRSGSMMGELWEQTVKALTAFFQDPASAQINIALNFFGPRDENVEGNEICNPVQYNPPQVPGAPPLLVLPDDAAKLVGELNAPESDPGGTTPMYGALKGTLQFATAFQDAHPEHKVIVVFTSDGEPCCGECEEFNGDPSYEDVDPKIKGLAASAYNYNLVQTYVVAIEGADVDELNKIAAAGGTGQVYDVTADIALFKQKMEEIRSNALGCEYLIPDPEEGEFDPTKLNVQFTPGGGKPETIPQAGSAQDCGAGQGWYYDDPLAPLKIFLCPKTCTKVQSDQEGKITMLFGCPTEVN
ncbi:MAG: VWA domain-containing protein [Deltaproteobacteria bacterium]|nr:VWA domain-containing protein [Deltaproteobacteria bacterium]